MKRVSSILFTIVTGLFVSAHASLIVDFTDDSWGAGQVPSPVTVNYSGLDVTLTSHPSNYSAIETCVDTLGLGMSCDHDGIGIGDDEVTWTDDLYSDDPNGEYLVVDFSYGVNLEAIIFLDLFPNEATGSEVAQMQALSGDGTVSWGVWQADEYQQWGWYVGTEANDVLGSGGFFDDVHQLIFYSDGYGRFTDVSDSDFALAGIQISTVPEPGTIALLLVGLIAVVGARRRMYKADSVAI